MSCLEVSLLKSLHFGHVESCQPHRKASLHSQDHKGTILPKLLDIAAAFDVQNAGADVT